MTSPIFRDWSELMRHIASLPAPTPARAGPVLPRVIYPDQEARRRLEDVMPGMRADYNPLAPRDE